MHDEVKCELCPHAVLGCALDDGCRAEKLCPGHYWLPHKNSGDRHSLFHAKRYRYLLGLGDALFVDRVNTLFDRGEFQSMEFA